MLRKLKASSWWSLVLKQHEKSHRPFLQILGVAVSCREQVLVVDSVAVWPLYASRIAEAVIAKVWPKEATLLKIDYSSVKHFVQEGLAQRSGPWISEEAPLVPCSRMTKFRCGNCTPINALLVRGLEGVNTA